MTIATPAPATAPAPTSSAPVTGQWSAAGLLPAPTIWQGQHDNAVVLTDGRVLVAGGAAGRLAAVAAATLYTPAANAWTATGALQTARRQHTATRLADGRVLVVGGIPGALQFPVPSLATAEIYDPASGTWAATGSMATARFDHSATLLPDGRVLVAGGFGARSGHSNGTLRSAEIYDPATGTWTPTAPMTRVRAGHPAVPLADGRVLVVGGLIMIGDGIGIGVAFCELYDPKSATWAPTGSMASPRGLHQATLLADGSVFVTGGDTPAVRIDGEHNPFSQWTTERYDPASGRWSATANLPHGHAWHRALTLKSGHVLVVGGTDSAGYDVGYQNALIYDPLSDAWTPIQAPAVGRSGLAAALLTDGRVLIAGGISQAGLATANPGSDQLTPTAELLTI